MDDRIREIYDLIGIKTNRDKLTNREFMQFEYSRLWSEYLDWVLAHKQEMEHGESPLLKRVYFDKVDTTKLPPNALEHARLDALLNLIVDNNMRLLKEIEALLGKDNP